MKDEFYCQLEEYRQANISQNSRRRRRRRLPRAPALVFFGIVMLMRTLLADHDLAAGGIMITPGSRRWSISTALWRRTRRALLALCPTKQA